MFNRKQSQVSFFQIAIGSSLVVSVAFVVTILVEAAAGMQSYLCVMPKPAGIVHPRRFQCGFFWEKSFKYKAIESCCAAARFALSYASIARS